MALLVGTAFDGNWEAMSGDIAFEKDIQRTISVDIRYIMFIIDQFAGATHLIDEMTIAPKHTEKMTTKELASLEIEPAIKDPNTIVKELLNSPGNNRVLMIDAKGVSHASMIGDQIATKALENNWNGIIF